MKKMKGFSILLLIPIIVLIIAIGGVFAYKLYSEGTKAKASEVPSKKIVPPLVEEAEKPSSGYGSVKGPTPATKSATQNETGSASGEIDIETLINEDVNADGPDFSVIDTSLTQL